MAGVISTGNVPAALWTGIRAWWGNNYNEHSLQRNMVFNVVTSSMAYEEDVELPGFGLAPIKQQGNPFSFTSTNQGATTRYTHVAYGLGFTITYEAMKDNKYPQQVPRYSRALAFSMRQTKEITGANVFNRGFNSAYAGGDGKELFATDHPTLNGTQSNKLAVAADLSEASLEDLYIQIDNATDTNGLRIKLMAQKLIVPPQLRFEARRLAESSQQVGTANNDVNTINGLFPGGHMVYNYLSDPDAFFITTNAQEGLISMEREAVGISRDNEFDTKNLRVAAYGRWTEGWTEWRGCFASAGA